MAIEVAQSLFNAIDTATKSQMTNMNTVMSVIGIVIGGFWVIYIQMKALYWYFEGLTVVIKDAFFTIFKACIILFMAFNISWYTSTVIPVVTDFPVWLGNTISGSGHESMNLVDSLINTYIDGFKAQTDSIKLSFWDASIGDIIVSIVAVVFYLIGGVPFLLVAVGTLITLKAATTLILIVGPIFIALLLFPQTSQYFYGWVGVIGGFILTQVLFSVVLGMEMSYINNFIIKNGTIETDFASCLSILLYFGAFTLLATELPVYAASIMGGAPSGGVGGIGGLLGKTTGAGAAGRMSRTLGSKLINRYHKRGKGRITT
ncbi:type IV secretion system protein [Salmonella enterica]|nr:type IV secretion system protein [Salmonella enterica]